MYNFNKDELLVIERLLVNRSKLLSDQQENSIHTGTILACGKFLKETSLILDKTREMIKDINAK